jgi:hypothetical protein
LVCVDPDALLLPGLETGLFVCHAKSEIENLCHSGAQGLNLIT